MDDIIGKTAKAAVEKLISEGKEVRIISIDGKDFHTTSGCCGGKSGRKILNRVNLRIRHNKVIDAFRG